MLEAYKDQVEFLRRELERKDILLVFLTQRIPELEARLEDLEPSEKASEGTAKDKPPPSNWRPHSAPHGGTGSSGLSRAMRSKSFWRKLFG